MTPTDFAERLAVVRAIRARAADSFTDALSHGSGRSERAICEQWVRGIAAKGLRAEGWYQPPPLGACVLIGHPTDQFKRLDYRSLRDPATWSKDEITLHDESLVYGYASPASLEGGLIGDIGITLYFGSQQWIHEHTLMCLRLTADIAQFAEVGMEFRELFHRAQSMIERAGMANEASSSIGEVPNIGHTVPWTYEDYTSEERQILADPNQVAARNLISRRRVRINGMSSLKIRPTMAFTVEPQISSRIAPICSYHVIVTFNEGMKQIDHSFERVFDRFGMDDHAQLAQGLNS